MFKFWVMQFLWTLEITNLSITMENMLFKQIFTSQ